MRVRVGKKTAGLSRKTAIFCRLKTPFYGWFHAFFPVCRPILGGLKFKIVKRWKTKNRKFVATVVYIDSGPPALFFGGHFLALLP